MVSYGIPMFKKTGEPIVLILIVVDDGLVPFFINLKKLNMLS